MTTEELDEIRKIIKEMEQELQKEKHYPLPNLPPYYQPLPNYYFPYHQHCPCCPCRRCCCHETNLPYNSYTGTGTTDEPFKITW